MEIGWTKPTEAPTDWDDAKIKATNFNSMALKAKSSDTDESSTGKDLTRTKSNLVLHNSRPKTKERRILGMAVSTLFPQDQSALSDRVSVT